MAHPWAAFNAAAQDMNRDPLSHCRMTAGLRADTDEILLVIVPTVQYRGTVGRVTLTDRNVSEQTVLWEHQVKALEHFVSVLQLALDRTREALEHRRQQERAL